MPSFRKCCLCDSKPPAVTLHIFPKDDEGKSVWKNICGIRPIDDVSRFFLCSNHFTPNDYMEPKAKELGGKLRLKPGRFPTVKVPVKFVPKTVCVEPSTSEQTTVNIPGQIASESICDKSPTLGRTNVQISSQATCDVVPSTSKQPDIVQTPKKRKFHEPRFVGDVTSPDLSTPKKAKRAFNLAQTIIQKEKAKNRSLRDKNKRLLKKITSLQDIVKHLKQNNSLSEDAADTLMNIVPASVQQIIERKLKKNKKEKYSPSARSFALTLQFYSSKAYEYVRKTWENLLPHPSTLRAWYSKVDGKPGFSAEAFQAISSQEKMNHILLNVVIDEMSIREQVVFENNRLYGGVDFGTETETDGDNIPTARLALVFMAVAINSNWKVPIGYFLIKSLTGSERANLLNKCFELLYDTGAEVCSITFDGAAIRNKFHRLILFKNQ